MGCRSYGLPVAFLCAVALAAAGADEQGASWIHWTAAGASPSVARISAVVPGSAAAQLTASLPGCYHRRVKLPDQHVYDALLAPGAFQLPTGHPNLPAFSQWVLVPNGARVELVIAPGAAVDAGEFDIAPVQPPRIDSSDKTPPFAVDREVYARAVDYPGVLAGAEPIRQIRGQAVTLVRLYPVQYNPATRRVTVYPDLRVTVRFEGGGFSAPQRLRQPAYDAFFRRLAPNAAAVLALPAEAAAALAGPIATAAGGCELLIISAPPFVSAAQTLADWRTARGLPARVVTTDETGVTTNSIRQYIRNAYTSWNPAPAYVLLIGDSAEIPVWYVSETGSDLFYVDMSDPFDHVADLAIGRWPVETPDQANRCAARVIQYETERLPDAYYTRSAHPAAFQDGEDNPPDHYEDRRFAKTSEDIWQYMNAHGYSPQRIYTTYDGFTHNHSSISPSNWATFVEFVFENDGGGGLPVPPYLQKPVFPWDGTGAQIRDAFHGGAFLVTHRDHAGVDGWSAPAFSSVDADALTNGDLRPVVFSINCLSGRFDNPAYVSFCERLIRHPTGGAIGCIASTRVSLSGRNDRMAWGWMDAIWTNFTEYFGCDSGPAEPLYRMGDVHNYGKLYMMNYFIFNDDTRLSLEEFHWLGDPTLEIWTGVPGTLDVSHEPEHVVNEVSFTVNVAQDGALVCCATTNAIVGTAISTGGVAEVALPAGLAEGPLRVTVTKHNYLPYRGTTVVTRAGLDHYVADTGSNSYPYTNWGMAAWVIQDAIDVATNGDDVIVADGTYQTGGRAVPGYTAANRVMINKPIRVRSVHGPDLARIRGAGLAPSRTSVRPAYVGNGGRLEGFKLYGGSTREINNPALDAYYDCSGGGVLVSTGAVLSGCVVMQNSSAYGGGGVFCYRGGTVENTGVFSNRTYTGSYGGGIGMRAVESDAPLITGCTVYWNRADGRAGGIAAAANATIRDCSIWENVSGSYGGGLILEPYNKLDYPRVERCRIVGNYSTSAGVGGGGIMMMYGGTVANCLIVSNWCARAGGVYCYWGGTVVNCTIAANRATTGAAGGVLCDNTGTINWVRIRNSIIYSNAAVTCQNWTNSGQDISFRNCCTWPTNDLPGSDNTDAEPGFVNLAAGDSRLRAGSPCINAGSNAWVDGATDIEGNSRVLLGSVDIGAYEFTIGALQPWLAITNEPAAKLPYEVDSYTLRGVENIHVVGSMWVSNAASGVMSFFNAAPEWVAQAIPLVEGANLLYVCGSNYLNEIASDNAIVTRETLEEVTPRVTVTSAPDTIPLGQTTAVVAGTCTNIAGLMGWRRETDPSPSMHAFEATNGVWEVTLSGIAGGREVFAITGTNRLGHTASTNVIILALAPESYVSPFGSHSTPFTNWATAAHDIQSAIDAIISNGTVWVSNGVYATGARTVGGWGGGRWPSRVVIDGPRTVRSVNGPAATIIEGFADPVTGGCGSNAIRCAYVANGGILAGFTLTNGHTRGADDGDPEEHGGGAYVERGVLSNCVVVANAAGNSGGGVYCSHGSVLQCVVRGNQVFEQGGGIAGEEAVLRQCLVRDNAAQGDWTARGGGISIENGEIANCLVVSNRADHSAGGVYLSHTVVFRNCTVAHNEAGSFAGGVYLNTGNTMTNCIVVGNACPAGPNWFGNWAGVSSHCCISDTNGLAMQDPWVTNAPLFVAADRGDYRLATNSPCLNAGWSDSAMESEEDLDGRPRIVGPAADIGAYEFLSPAADADGDGMPDWWEWDHAHSLTNMDAGTDADGDGAANLHEYLAGMDPFDPESVFRVTEAISPPASRVWVLSWSSASNLFYRLEATTNLFDLFDMIEEHIPATPPMNTYTDTTANGAARFYRVQVE